MVSRAEANVPFLATSLYKGFVIYGSWVLRAHGIALKEGVPVFEKKRQRDL